MVNNALTLRRLSLYAGCGLVGAIVAHFVAEATLPLFAGTAFWVLPVTLIAFIGCTLIAVVAGLSWAGTRRRSQK